MIKRIPIHTLLLAFYAVLFMYAENIVFVKLKDVYFPFFRILLGTTTLFVLSRFLFRNWKKAGIFTSVALVLFFSYGHYYEMLYPNRIPIINVRFDHNFYKWSCLIIIIFLSWRLFKTRSDLDNSTSLFNFVALLLIAMPLYKIGSHHYNDSRLQLSETPTEWLETEDTDIDTKPSIYYLIMDAYGRSDVLEDMYGYDNADFIEFLEEKGFYVADKSCSNYSRTILSLPSSLNMIYLDSLAQSIGDNYKDEGPLIRLINENKTLQYLKNIGYKSIAFDAPVFEAVFLDSADMFYETPGAYINLFENELLNSSIISAFYREKRISEVDAYEFHRKKVLDAFEKMKKVSKAEEPFYVHGHVLSPHQPFVFDENGDPIEPEYDYSVWKPVEHAKNPDLYREQYINQLKFINTKLKEVVTAILENSKEKPIIIIQGDHGPSSELTDTKSFEGNNFRERMSILNAYYFPDGDYSRLYDSITPVNTYRVIFNQFFNKNLPLLEDRSYYATWENSYEYYDVTDSVRIISQN